MSLPGISKARFVRALQRRGFVRTRQKGSHQKVGACGRPRVYVFFHAREDLRPAALRRILADARIAEDEFFKALR